MKIFSSIVFIMVICLNGSDTSYVIFIVLKWLLSSNGFITRTHLMAVFLQNKTGTDFIFWNVIVSCMNSALSSSKLVAPFLFCTRSLAYLMFIINLNILHNGHCIRITNKLIRHLERFVYSKSFSFQSTCININLCANISDLVCMVNVFLTVFS